MEIREYFKGFFSKDFIKGVGSILNLAGSSYRFYWMRKDLTPQEQDILALKKDWEAVGNDLRYAIDKHERSLSNKVED